jgi:hypothetical protein
MNLALYDAVRITLDERPGLVKRLQVYIFSGPIFSKSEGGSRPNDLDDSPSRPFGQSC